MTPKRRIPLLQERRDAFGEVLAREQLHLTVGLAIERA